MYLKNIEVHGFKSFARGSILNFITESQVSWDLTAAEKVM